MRRFSVLIKPTKTGREIARPQNTTKADVNEILVGYFIRPGSATDPFKYYKNKTEVKSAYNQKSEQLPYEFWDMEVKRAKVMAKAFMKYAKDNKYGTVVKEIVWTARNGSLGNAVGYPVAQTGPGKNPSDIVVCFSNPTITGSSKSKTKRSCSWLGLSAKSTGTPGDIAFTNPGLGVVSQDLFGSKTHLPQMIEKHKKKFESKYSQLQGLNNTQLKSKLDADKGLREEARKFGLVCLADIRDEILTKMMKLDYNDWQKFMLDFVQSDFEGPHYLKITGHGQKEPYTASIEDPSANKKTKGIKGPSLLLEESGDTSINVYSFDDKPLFKVRMKWSSAPLASSIKLSGDPLGS
tara:strand:+ start:28 stop:1080 length:1053 start_codon:yes stop_codon:yes gene_type:complete